ncbi:unnamed protein product [Miscanthus lutarioriparius]|uniref:ATP-dependent DNA helicase n=1 Tax=Miscanthus lutarioriparius TaxID=422564 RepID=A0A811PYN9_9POAL|nr:unnamed protein product [Miscanthus lutarioriparius]
MRLASSSSDPDYQKQLAEFSKWILDVGEGKIPSVAREGETEPSWIKIPTELLLLTEGDKLSCIVNAIYPELKTRYHDASYLSERAILTPTNELTDSINDHIVSQLPGSEREYLSSDSIAKSVGPNETYDLLYPVEFLNSINGNNFPQHRLVLKKGVPGPMLLRNLNQSDGLCNGTRLIIVSLGQMVIEAKIMIGNHSGQDVIIPWITLTLKNNKWPFVLQRRQYPIKVCYGMTINKSQGQTLSAVGVYLRRPVFSHVAAAKPTYKPFDAQLMIEFSEYTSIRTTQNPPNTFPAYVYKLTPFTRIIPADGLVSAYTDVLGYITKYTSLSSIVPRGKERGSILREVFIKDMSDNELRITLWGDQAINFTVEHLNTQDNPKVVVGLFVGCMPRKWFKDQPIYIERPPPSEEQGCKKKSNPQPAGGYKCTKCHGSATTPRYLLSFVARDDTAEANFFAYDDIAKQIIQKECKYVLNPLNIAAGLPQALQSVITKRFIFSVALTEDSYTSKAKRQYLVKAILDRPGRRAAPINAVSPTAAPWLLPAPAAIPVADTPDKQLLPAPATTAVYPPSTPNILQSAPPQPEALSIDGGTSSVNQISASKLFIIRFKFRQLHRHISSLHAQTPALADDPDNTPLKDLLTK